MNLLEILQFVLSGFWTFVGTVILLSMLIGLIYAIIIGIGWSLSSFILAVRGKSGKNPPKIEV